MSRASAARNGQSHGAATACVALRDQRYIALYIALPTSTFMPRPTMKPPRIARTAALLCALLLAGKAALAADLTVSAASSLGNAFRDIARAYEAAHPDDRVQLNVGASGALLQQLVRGAPVDVFASADPETMDEAIRQRVVLPADRHDFAGNTLVLVVPAGAARAPKTLADLTQPAVQRVAMGNPASVPVGRYAKRALENAGLWPQVQPRVIHAQNARQSLDYVARGEVDAGFVFATDAGTMKDKVTVALHVALDRPITYPIAHTSSSAHTESAKRFVAFVLSPTGQGLLARHGFRKP